MIPSATSPRAGSVTRRRGDGEGDIGGMRPRNRRVGGLSAAASQEQELISTSNTTSTPEGSRTGSPLPAKHPSRRSVRSSAPERMNSGTSLLGPPPVGRGSGTSSPILGGGSFGNALAGFGFGKTEGGGGGWMGSWNALQGLANSVLGNVDDGRWDTSTNGGLAGKKKGDVRLAPRKLPDKWGAPMKKDTIGEGSTAATAEREASVRAKKMTRVLEGRDEPTESRDTNGRFKLRSSLDEPRPGSSHEDDQALVYIHHVQKNDTLQGVILRYNCKPEVFRKANRFWPNDSIQVRKTVVLPVDACDVKGRPCDPPDVDDPSRGVDLLAPTPSYEDPPLSGTWPSSKYNGASAERPDDSENPWIHVRWVLIDSSPNTKPVEIARMPRKTLGYFPPRRRKSQNTMSTVSTPRASLDFPASTITPIGSLPLPDGSSPNSRKTSNLSYPTHLSSSMTVGSYFPPSPMSLSGSTRPRRERRESVGEAADRMGWMRGPGGVGTLNVRKPGPGNDGLNSWARKHFAGLAIDSLPSTSIQGAEQAHFGFNGNEELPSIVETVRGGFTGSETRRELGVGSQGQGMGLENAAAAVEGWVRKLGKIDLLKSVPGTPRTAARKDDLIELVDGAGSDDGRWELSLERDRAGLGGGGSAMGSRSVTPVGTMSLPRDRGVSSGTGVKGGKGD